MKSALGFGLSGLLGLLGCAGSRGDKTAAVATIAPPVSSPVVSASALPPIPPAPPATPREQRLIARMLTRVSNARGIAAPNPIPGAVLSRADLMARVKAHVAREMPNEAIRNEGSVLSLLGFVPTSFDYEAAEFALLEAQLAGYYEPADKTMYLAADLKDDDAEATLAHELVHALQDLKWDLKTRSKYDPGHGDKSSAVSALAEGDATSAMFDVIFSAKRKGATALDIRDDEFVTLLRDGMNTGPAAQAPKVMRNGLAAPYIVGTLFVHALRRKGGWEAVNRAWDNPPVTSEQILHVDKWEAHETPIDVPTPPFTTLGAGFSVADADTMGELGVRLAVEEWTDIGRSETFAAGWGGDRGVLLKNRQEQAFVWKIRFDEGAPSTTAAMAQRYAVLRTAWARLGNVSEQNGVACVEREGRGPIAVGTSGKSLVIVAGPVKGTAATGNCAKSRAWVQETLR